LEFQYSIWLSVIPTLVALAAAVFAWRTSRAALQAVAAAQQVPRQYARGLGVTVVDGRAHRDLTTDARDYAFLLAVENGAGAETTVSDVELRVSYRTRANFCGAVDLAVAEDGADSPNAGSTERRAGPQPRLHVPLRLAAGQATSGWVEFHTANIIPRHCRVDGYAIIVTDAGGLRTTADATLPKVLHADTDGRGPSSWGWD
jgi:hypothetical protein